MSTREEVGAKRAGEGTGLSDSVPPYPIRSPTGEGRARGLGAPTNSGRIRMSGNSLVWFLLLAALLIAVAIGWIALPVRQWIESFDAWIGALGGSGIALFALVYIVAVVLLAPAELLSIAAGYLFGAWGFPIVAVAATIGAALAFLLSRYVVRARLRRWLQSKPKYAAIDRAVAEEGWQIVALLRLNPLVPFNLQNYFFGATEVGFLPYVMATFFGIMPGAAFYVYLGTLGREAGSGRGGTRWIVLGAGLALTAAALFLIIRRANAKLAKLGVTKH
jgi:uncharacterized membrane protein YdjX (TVP38/TMEM64 family)